MRYVCIYGILLLCKVKVDDSFNSMKLVTILLPLRYMMALGNGLVTIINFSDIIRVVMILSMKFSNVVNLY